MCGIAGIIQPRYKANDIKRTIFKMMDSILHRGPDANGTWSDNESNIALAHTRLSIIDLSPTGQQPMQSASGRWVIVYNGEAYNFKQLRQRLENNGHVFKGHSDTEVILESIDQIGVEATVNQLIGMFAFAAWDKQEKKLYLVRDRLGIKPLYWGHFGDLFLFGSELKALRACNAWKPEINRDALSNYFRHNYIPTPHTIYNNVYKLMPGHILSYQAGQEPVIKPYWSLDTHTQPNELSAFSDQEYIEKLDNLLQDSISQRMIADVPLGAFLSGGIDSSTVAAIMQANSDKAINTFTIGFHEQGYNEAVHAREIAKHLGTHHTELYVSPEQAMAVIPKLQDIYDEPFSDSSQIPTFLVSELTRQHVTVSLSGDGGDECFAGYTRYFLAKRIQKFKRSMPRHLKTLSAGMIHRIPPNVLDTLAKIIPNNMRPSQFGHRLHKFADVLTKDDDGFYRSLISHWENPNNIVINGQEHRGLVWDDSIKEKIPSFVDRMRYLDLMTYLPDDILTKVDRASMAVSLEARVPLLDHRVVEFSWQLPMHMKIRNGQGKWILRQVLNKYIPKELIERPKMGFGVPIDAWLRGPLRDWAESLLDEKLIREQGYLNFQPIKQKWDEHISGDRNWQYLIWDVLMFQAWHARWA